MRASTYTSTADRATSDAPSFRPCALIPTYNNPVTLRRVVLDVREAVDEVLVINDGSDAATAVEVDKLVDEGLAIAFHRQQNGGKGAAVKDGLRWAQELGFSHALQVDADGQHDLSRAGVFLEMASAQPGALVLGYPEFGEDVPAVRQRARKITNFWINWEVGRGRIRDGMVGFRVYPVAQTLTVPCRGNRMEFDIEIVVRLAWTGMPILNMPVAVRYLHPEEGGRSSFRPFEDNLRISWLHTRLSVAAFFRRLGGRLPRPT